MSEPIFSYKYQAGGRLPVDAPSYVMRQADEDLYQALRSGEFCYVLNSRQMGKSSLRVQVAKRLQAEGIICATVDLSGIGNQNITPDQWYADIIMRLVRNFQLASKVNVRQWLAERRDLSPVGRLGELLQDTLTALIEQPIVIFFDEIDSTLSLPFDTDDFFALIRSCYEHQRLTFALLGVATPSDLITDKTRTPFNLGRAIELNGFRLQEIEPLEQGMVGLVSDPKRALKEILNWTRGQPFLTQKLCLLLMQEVEGRTDKLGDKVSQDNPDSPPSYLEIMVREMLMHHGDVAEQIAEIVRTRVIENWAAQDEPPHLRTIRDRILINEQRASKLLKLYWNILQQGSIAADDSAETIELLLSGLVVKQQGRLRVYNRIYQEVFNQAWVERQLSNLRPYTQNLKNWIDSKFQDESHLLQGKALKDAQLWAQGRSLSHQETDFLAVSEERQQQELQQIWKRAGLVKAADGVVSLLDAATSEKVEKLWAELAERFGLKGIYSTPFPHFSYHLARQYDLHQLEAAMQGIAQKQRPFQVNAWGLGIFTGKAPVLYVPIVRCDSLNRLHQQVWQEVAELSADANPYYYPDNWIPHISLALEDTDRDSIAEAARWLGDRIINWEITVSNLSFIQETERGSEVCLQVEFNG